MLRWARERLVVAGLFAALVAVVSCSLNPQPEPPGDKSVFEPGSGGPLSGSTGSGGSPGTAGSGLIVNPTTGAGGGGGGAAMAGADAGQPPVADGAAGVPAEGGAADASSAADAGTDGGASDGAQDSSTDVVGSDAAIDGSLD
jgi:hypothetical protein